MKRNCTQTTDKVLKLCSINVEHIVNVFDSIFLNRPEREKEEKNQVGEGVDGYISSQIDGIQKADSVYRMMVTRDNTSMMSN